jgi:arylsulfatase A
MGFGDVSSNNPRARTKTPNIDAMGRSGIRFLEAHSSGSTCIPSRYGLVTGRYQFRDPGAPKSPDMAKLGGAGYLPPLIESGRETIGTLMQRAGYATACIGKWHLGMNWERKDPTQPVGLLDPDSRRTNTDFSRGARDGPNSRGFDYSFIIPSSASDPPFIFIRNGAVLDPEMALIPEIYPTRQKEPVYEWDLKYVSAPGDVYWARGVIWKNGEIAKSYRIERCADEIVAEATAYIARQARANPSQPFLLYLPLPGPHTPWLPNQKFRGTSEIGAYGDYVAQMDDAVGRVREALAASGVAENTLVLFTSDNGAHWGEEDVQQYGHLCSPGRRGQKGDIWEGGHRVPLVVTWPRQIKGPATYAHQISLVDIIATLADITGEPINDAHAEDSFSFRRVIEGDYTTPTRDSIIHGWGTAIVKDGWKLISFLGSGGFTSPNRLRPVPGGPRGQLYHLELDPGETTNLYLQEPARVAELSQLLEKQVTQGFTRPRAKKPAR